MLRNYRSSRQAALGTYVILQALIVGQVIAAWNDRMFTVTQMQSRGLAKGLPLVWHFGIWSDLLVISALLALLVGRYGAAWNRRDTALAALASAGVTLAMGNLWAFGDPGGAHVINHATTIAGVLHLCYVWLSLLILALFFFATGGITPRVIKVVSAILVVHVFFGTHLAFGLLKETFDFPWYPGRPLCQPLPWIVFAAVSTVLLLRMAVFQAVARSRRFFGVSNDFRS